MEETAETPEGLQKFNKKELMSNILYSAAKGIGGLALKAFTNLRVEGKENVPMRGKAIITTISQDTIRDIFIISQISGRKIHFVLSPKLMKHQIAGPILKTMGMIRSTTSKDDQEPIDKAYKILNEDGDLLAMTPQAKYERDVQIKSMAAIIKFGIMVKADLIPVAISSDDIKLFNFIATQGLIIRVGTPIKLDHKLNREKFRDKRYELAEDIINIIDFLKKPEENEEFPKNRSE